MLALVKSVTHSFGHSLLYLSASTCRMKFASDPRLGSMSCLSIDKPLSFTWALPEVKTAFRVSIKVGSDEFRYCDGVYPWSE